MSDEPRRGIAPHAEPERPSEVASVPDHPSGPSRAWTEATRPYETRPDTEPTSATPAYRPAATPAWYPPLPDSEPRPALADFPPAQPVDDAQPAPYSPAQLSIFASPPPHLPPAPAATPADPALSGELARHSTEPRASTGGSFGGALGWTIAGTLVPGIGLIRGRRPVVGILTLLAFLALAGGVGYLLYERHLAVRVAMNPGAAIIIAAACAMLAVLVAGMVLATYIANRPTRVRGGQRVLGGLVVALLCFAVSAPLAVGSAVSYSQARLVSTLFASSASATRPTIVVGPTNDLWSQTPRINVLLLSGTGGTTDSMIVASIDTATGNTVLISVPRTIAKLPFPESSPLRTYFPDGYWDGVSAQNPASYASSMWSTLPSKVPANALGTTSNLGADALKLAIGEALGLRIDYYVYADLATLYTLLDALGGVTLNVTSPIPAGASAAVNAGAGRQLDANQTLAYAWSGSSDAELMLRQRCVIDAVMTQIGPLTVLRYAGIAKAGATARTDVPQSMLAMLTELAVRVRRGQVTSLQFTPGANGFDAANPSFATMRQQVSAAVAGSVDATSAKSSPAIPIRQACAYS